MREAYYTGLGDAVEGFFATSGIGRHYESGVQAMRLILAGVFDRLSEQRVVLGHWRKVVLFHGERLHGMQQLVPLRFGMDDKAAERHHTNMRVAAATLCAFGLYLLFAGTLSATEAVTGALLSGSGGASLVVFARISQRRFRFAADHIRPGSRALARVPAATVRTGMALAGALISARGDLGRAEEMPFRFGARDAPAERARRATAVLAASLAPNSFVMRVDAGRDAALVHGIEGRVPPSDPEWLA